MDCLKITPVSSDYISIGKLILQLEILVCISMLFSGISQREYKSELVTTLFCIFIKSK
ncbi:MAG: hypothetical protein O3B00_01565 [archaeon]|nr:hypothetical protein [archaeon]MDA1130172.1 hypothetical protein [archaeon]